MLGSLSLSGVQVMMHPASVVGQALFHDQPWFSNPRAISSHICMRENRLFQQLIPLAIVTYTPYEKLVSNSGMD
jgi:cytochrome c peroxidase